MGPALFCMPLLPVLKRIREGFQPRGVETPAYLDDVSIGMMEVTSDPVEVATFLQQEELSKIGIVTNPRKTFALPPQGYVLTLKETTPLENIDVRIAERGGVKVVGVPVGTDAYYAMESVMEMVENGGAEQFVRMLQRMRDKQTANLIASSSVMQRTAYIEDLSLLDLQNADSSAVWTSESLLNLSGTASESSFFGDGCPVSRSTLQSHQQAQASLSTEAGRLALSSTESRRMSARIENMVATVPKVLADLSGVMGAKIRRGLSNSDLAHRILRSIRGLRDVHGVS